MALKQHTVGKDWLDHYSNGYGELVEALQAACEVADCYPQFDKYGSRWRDLLRKYGEEVPPKAGE